MLPLISVVAALASGGQLVAHSAGGLIVLSGAGSYVAGTYISTAALAAFLNGTAIVAATGSAAAIGGAAVVGYGTVSGAILSVIGSAGWFGTTLGAKGLIGFLMGIGLLSAVPVFIPITIAIVFLLVMTIAVVLLIRVRKLKTKVNETPEGEEAHFTEKEAKLVSKILQRTARKGNFFKRFTARLWPRLPRPE